MGHPERDVPGRAVLRRVGLTALLVAAGPALAQEEPESDAEEAEDPLAIPADVGAAPPPPVVTGQVQTKDKRLTWFAIPVASYDSNDGLGFGGRLELAWLEEEVTPYRASAILQAFVTLNGYHEHRLTVDLVDLGPKSRLRLTGRAQYQQWLNDGYWGLGNSTTWETEYRTATFALDDPRRKRYFYTLIQPSIYLTARLDLADNSPWSFYTTFNPKFSIVRTYADSLLEEDQPYGMEGGFTTQVGVGLLYDTRAPSEIDPKQGWLVELGGRFAPGWSGEAGTFGGPLLSVRGFGTAGRFTAAFRVMGEYLIGEVPFYEMVHWGGFTPTPGFGGYLAVRGIRFGRYHGPGKVIFNSELRTHLFTTTFLKRSLDGQIAPTFDGGFVFGAGESYVPGTLPVHPTLGIAGRLIWDETFVGRLDVAWSLDHMKALDGTITPTYDYGLYLAFGYPF